jgi:hypothetical protein
MTEYLQMMDDYYPLYRSLYHELRLPQAAIDIAFRSIALPFYSSEDSFDAYGFAPALLPLWTGDGIPTYIGYWKHWFGTRQMTLVKVDAEEFYATREVARTFPQLACEAVLRAIESADALTPKITEFGIKAGLTLAEMQPIEKIWQEYGDEDAGLISLPAFASAPPLACFLEENGYQGYTGDFPHDAMRLTEEAVRNMCTEETSRELQRRIAALPFAPPWFMTKAQAPVFDALLQQGDYQGAWMSLNSAGWRFIEMKDALRRLAGAANVPGFSLLAAAWTSVPQE